jgi:sulfide:quinone oxidoreductase
VRKQAPVLTHNLLRVIEGQTPDQQYDGYAACPLVTGYGKLVLAEFDYDGKPQETFPFDQSKERLSMYLFKQYALPALYWHGILQGRV